MSKITNQTMTFGQTTAARPETKPSEEGAAFARVLQRSDAHSVDGAKDKAGGSRAPVYSTTRVTPMKDLSGQFRNPECSPRTLSGDLPSLAIVADQSTADDGAAPAPILIGGTIFVTERAFDAWQKGGASDGFEKAIHKLAKKHADGASGEGGRRKGESSIDIVH